MRARLFRRDQRGAAVVEAAIVLPTIIALMFGMLEMGLYFKDSLTLSEATKDAAHTGAEYAQDPGADYYILQGILRAKVNGSIQEVIVYDAANVDPTNGSAQSPPAGCLASATGVKVAYSDSNLGSHLTGAIGSCNVYIAANGDFTHPLSDFTTGVFTNSQNWPGGIRLQNTTDTRYLAGSNNPAGSGPDSIGVWVKTTHNWATGFISTAPTTITDQAVFKIEPRQ